MRMLTGTVQGDELCPELFIPSFSHSTFPFTGMALPELAGPLSCAGSASDGRVVLFGTGAPTDLAGSLERSFGLGSPKDRKSTRLNSSHLGSSYAVFCFI